MKFKVGLLVVCGALLLCVTGCRSTETQSFQVTPLTQTEQNSLEQLGEQLFVAVATQDYAAAKSLFAEDFGKDSDNEAQFKLFCNNFADCGTLKNKELVTTINRTPFKLLVYKLSFEKTMPDSESEEIIVPQERLFVMGMGNIDGKLVVVDFRPVL